jgi:hypothetical protein
MATITVRFRGICCFIDQADEKIFEKRVVLPNGRGHQHSDREEHLPIIEYFADDLKVLPPNMTVIEYTRPGDGGKYQGIVLDKPVCIELLGTVPQGPIQNGLSLDESLIHLNHLVPLEIHLKRTLVGPALNVDSNLVAAVIDLPQGMLLAGPPEPTITRFTSSPKFTERRAARWLEHVTTIENGTTPGRFGLKLTLLANPELPPTYIWFEKTTRMITIANEPLRFIVGHFVTKPPKVVSPLMSGPTPIASFAPATSGAPPAPAAPVLSIAQTPGKPTGHFDMYWDLISDPPSRPTPDPFLGTGPGCAPANIP